MFADSIFALLKSREANSLVLPRLVVHFPVLVELTLMNQPPWRDVNGIALKTLLCLAAKSQVIRLPQRTCAVQP
jgi:hypothetical protein